MYQQFKTCLITNKTSEGGIREHAEGMDIHSTTFHLLTKETHIPERQTDQFLDGTGFINSRF